MLLLLLFETFEIFLGVEREDEIMNVRWWWQVETIIYQETRIWHHRHSTSVLMVAHPRAT